MKDDEGLFVSESMRGSGRSRKTKLRKLDAAMYSNMDMDEEAEENEDTDADTDMDINADANPNRDLASTNTRTEGPAVSYDIVTVIRKKIVFSKRPIPIVPSHLKGIGSVAIVPKPDAATTTTTDIAAGGGADEPGDE